MVPDSARGETSTYSLICKRTPSPPPRPGQGVGREMLQVWGRDVCPLLALGGVAVPPHPDPGVGAPACTYPAVLVRTTLSSGGPGSSQDPARSPCTSPKAASKQEETPGQRSVPSRAGTLPSQLPFASPGESTVMSFYRTCRSSWGAFHGPTLLAVPHWSIVWGHHPIVTPLVPPKNHHTSVSWLELP